MQRRGHEEDESDPWSLVEAIHKEQLREQPTRSDNSSPLRRIAFSRVASQDTAGQIVKSPRPNPPSPSSSSLPERFDKKPFASRSPDILCLEEFLQVHEGLPAILVETYMRNLHKNYCDTCRSVAKLSGAEMKELGIHVGHRSIIKEAAGAIHDSRREGYLSSEGGPSHGSSLSASTLMKIRSRQRLSPTTTSECEGGTAHSLTMIAPPLAAQLSTENSNNFSAPVTGNMLLQEEESFSGQVPPLNKRRSSLYNRRGNDGSPIHISSPTHQLSDVKWIVFWGQRPTLQQFLSEMSELRRKHGFPSSFDRMFYDNKPMPFVEISDASTGKGGGDASGEFDGVPMQFGLLLRIPDLSDEDGTTIATITNRVCIMVNKATRVIITYHNCEEDVFDGFFQEWESGRAACSGRGGVEEVADTMIRRVVRTYSKGVNKLREIFDRLENPAMRLDETTRVTRLFGVGKKATVYKRCADASSAAVNDLEAIPWMEPYCKNLCDILGTAASMSDELCSNSHSSIDMIIALSEFKSNANLKHFTYLSIFFQPVMIATGWYGMNWVNMPEIEMENGYFTFAGIIWIFAICFVARFLFHEEITAWWKLLFGSNESDLREKAEEGDAALEEVKTSENGEIVRAPATNPNREWRSVVKRLGTTAMDEGI